MVFARQRSLKKDCDRKQTAEQHDGRCFTDTKQCCENECRGSATPDQTHLEEREGAAEFLSAFAITDAGHNLEELCESFPSRRKKLVRGVELRSVDMDWRDLYTGFRASYPSYCRQSEALSYQKRRRGGRSRNRTRKLRGCRDAKRWLGRNVDGYKLPIKVPLEVRKASLALKAPRKSGASCYGWIQVDGNVGFRSPRRRLASWRWHRGWAYDIQVRLGIPNPGTSKARGAINWLLAIPEIPFEQ